LLGSDPLFGLPLFRLVSPVELGPYLLLGILLGACAPWFVGGLRASERAFRLLHLPVAARFLLGGLLVGALSLQRPEVWGNGSSPVTMILLGTWGWKFVMLVLVAKLVATFATVGSGAVGGVFTPTLLVGASLGFLMGTLVHELLPTLSAEPSAYALVGMGAFLAATTHAPLMAILVVFEMTLDYDIVLPLMVSCIVAHYTSRSSDGESIYSRVLRWKAAGRPADPIGTGTIRGMLRQNPVSVRDDTTFDGIVRAFLDHRHGFLYVVDRDGRFLGAISLHDIKAHMNDPALGRLLIASELMDPGFPCVAQDAALGEALTLLLRHEGERVPVVDDLERRRLVGTVSKRDVLLALSLEQSKQA
jgi:CIC family chloride channel protein